MKLKNFTRDAAVEFLDAMIKTDVADETLGTNIERLTGYEHKGEGFKVLVYGIIEANHLPHNPKIVMAVMDGLSMGAELGYMHGAKSERFKN